MIFASDLDRTLIYSRRFIKEVEKDNIVPVELYNEKIISYMTKQSLRLLQEISSKAMFIPITTRSIEQYSRISIFDESISIKYAVTTNGGTILIDKKLDTEWEDIVNRELKKCDSLEKVIETHKRMVKNPSILRYRVADEKFFYNIIDLNSVNETCHDYYAEFDEYLEKAKWSKYDQGRKVYYVPNVLTKEKALMYIMKKEGIEKTIVSGDSIMDLSMLEIASQGFVPLHGDLCDCLSDEHKKHINLMSEGFKGTEEILNIVKDICSKRL